MKHLAIFLIRIYQSLQASFYVGACRFHPTCSHYAIEAFETRGFFYGLWLTVYRLVRCQPFCKGGWDPVPTPAETSCPAESPFISIKHKGKKTSSRFESLRSSP